MALNMLNEIVVLMCGGRFSLIFDALAVYLYWYLLLCDCIARLIRFHWYVSIDSIPLARIKVEGQGARPSSRHPRPHGDSSGVHQPMRCSDSVDWSSIDSIPLIRFDSNIMPVSQGGGQKRGNPAMTTKTVTARRKGDPQLSVEGKKVFEISLCSKNRFGENVKLG